MHRAHARSEFEFSFLRSIGFHCSVIATAALLVGSIGCMQGLDAKADHDSLINDVWLVDFETQNAIAFLEKGGTHYDLLEHQDKNVDKEVVLPLLVRLRDEFEAETTVVCDEGDNWAWVLLVRLPANPVTRGKIEDAIKEADAGFEGVMTMEWGHQWLALNVEDAAEAEE